MIYLDNHSATRPCSAAIERMQSYLTEHWGASFSPHRMGQELIGALDSRYQMIYDLVGAKDSDTFVFTSSGAEAVCQVLWSIFTEKARKEGKCHFVATGLEDAPTMQMLHRLEELGCYVKIAPVDRTGQVDLKELEAMINPRTALVSATMAHGLTGVVQPVEEISKICKAKGVFLHVDASYAVGKLYLSFADLDVDYLTFSGDRIHAVKGSGGLFVKGGRPLVPLILGGVEQAGLRGGTFDIPSFMALSAAAAQSQLYLDAMGLEVVRLRDLLESDLVRLIPDAKPLLTEELRLPNTTVVSFPRAHGEALLYQLNRKGVLASIGGPYQQHLHRALQASGIDERTAVSAVSFALSRQTTEEEIRRAVNIIQEAVLRLRSLSQGVF